MRPQNDDFTPASACKNCSEDQSSQVKEVIHAKKFHSQTFVI